MKAAVGPLSTSPPTIGETATTGAAAARSASVMPGTSRIVRIEMTGFDGPRTMARAPAIASSTACGRAGRLDPLQLDAVDGPLAALADHELLEGHPAPAGQDARAHRLVGHRQHAGAQARAPRSARRWPR